MPEEYRVTFEQYTLVLPRPITGAKSINDGVIRIDPWDPEIGGTYHHPVVLIDGYAGDLFLLYRDGTGRPWIERYDIPGNSVVPGGEIHEEPGRREVLYLTSDDFDNPSRYGIPMVDHHLVMNYHGDGAPIEGAWRHPEEGERPLGVVESRLEESPPLEETTPLFGPGDQTPDPPYDPTLLPGHWDPVGLRVVPDEPTSSVGKVADDDAPWYTSYKPRPSAPDPLGEDPPDPTISDAAKVADDDAPGDQTPEGQPTTRRSAGLLGDEENEGDTQIPGGGGGAGSTQGGDPIIDSGLEPGVIPGGGGGAGGSAEGEGEPPPPVEPPSSTDPWDQYREGYWDPAALRWVPDEPTSSVGRILGEESTQDPVEGGGAGGGVDPSSPLDQASPVRLGSQIEQPTQEPPPEEPPPPEPGDEGEGNAAAPFSVDSTSFEGSTAQGFDPSVPLDRADPNLQSLDSSLFDFSAPGPTLDPGLFDEAEPGPTLDPRLFDSNAPGPTLDPALFDLNSPGPTVDPALFDARSPGPTLDPGLLDHDTPGPTLDANRLDPSAPGDTLDEAQLERASERPNSVEEPADVKDRGDTDPRAMEEPAAHPEPSTTPRHDDHDATLDVG